MSLCKNIRKIGKKTLLFSTDLKNISYWPRNQSCRSALKLFRELFFAKKNRQNSSNIIFMTWNKLLANENVHRVSLIQVKVQVIRIVIIWKIYQIWTACAQNLSFSTVKYRWLDFNVPNTQSKCFSDTFNYFYLITLNIFKIKLIRKLQYFHEKLFLVIAKNINIFMFLLIYVEYWVIHAMIIQSICAQLWNYFGPLIFTLN